MKKYQRRLSGAYRPDEAAAILGRTVAEVLRACREGVFPGARKTPFGWAIPQPEVFQIEKELETSEFLPRWKREEIYRDFQEILEQHGLQNGYHPEVPGDDD